MPHESIKNPPTSDNSFAPKLITDYSPHRVKFNGNCLRQDSVSFLHKNVVNLYISYKLDTWSKDLSTDFTLGYLLLGAVMVTKNPETEKYGNSGYSTGFDSRSDFLCLDCSSGKSVIIFGDDMSTSAHIDNKNQGILVFDEGVTQRLGSTILTAEAKYPINLTESGKRFPLSLHYNGSNSFLFVNAVKMYRSKVKDSEIKPYTLCLGNDSKDFTIDNMKKTGFK